MYPEYLMHFGVKGMHWGVRRYQNPDGSLTAAGKKKYYKTKKYGTVLSDNAKRYNANQKQIFEGYKQSVLYNAKRVNSKFDDAHRDFLEANKKNNEHFLRERDKWFNQEGKYKGKDYYQFKDIAADDWFKSEWAKKEQGAYNRIKSIIEEAVKESPEYKKTYKQITTNPQAVKTINYGEQAVKEIMGSIYFDAVTKQK